MGILSDIADAVVAYPHEYLTLEIIDVSPAAGTAVNVNEQVTFRIQVANSGPLDAKNLSILVEGLHGTEVKSGSAGAQWGDSFTWDVDTYVPAHSAQTPVVVGGSVMSFRPTQAFSTARSLVRVSVAGWDTDFEHIGFAHSRADAEAKGTYSAEVSPQ